MGLQIDFFRFFKKNPTISPILIRIYKYTIAYEVYKKSNVKRVGESSKMSIKYKVIAKGQPGAIGGGDKKYYASVKSAGVVDVDQLTRDIEKISTVSGADIRAVLYALVDVASNELADSKIVRLGDLGNLRITLKSNGHDAPSKVDSRSIKGVRVRFTPGKKLKEMQKTLTYKAAK